MIDNPVRWYALHTRSHFERKVHDALSGKAIESFLPCIQKISRRKDRRKTIMAPILPGYVFVHSNLDPQEHVNILKTVGVVRMITFMNKPVPANDEEISSLMILDGTDLNVTNRDYMMKGDRVRIMNGPLKGMVAYYLRHREKSSIVVVSIELLHRSLEVEIEGWELEKIDR